METRMLFGMMALVAAFGGAFGAVESTGLAMRKRWSALSAQGDRPSIGALVSWRLRNGFAWLRRPAVFLLAREKVFAGVEGLVLVFEARGLVTSAESLTTVLLLGTALLSAASLLAIGSVVAAVAVPSCAIALVSVVAGVQLDKRQEAVREEVPVALESMSACFGSGFTLMQTFRQVASDVRGPLGETFGRACRVLEMGGSAKAALDVLREGAYASELAFVAVALDVQHQSGGAMRQVLDAASDTVKSELTLRRALRVQTAQAKLSARVVVIMPFILVAAFSLASPDFLSPFFSGPAGYGLLALAITMQVAGIALVRRALSVDGVS